MCAAAAPISPYQGLSINGCAAECGGIRVPGLGFVPSPFMCKGEGRVRVSGRVKQHQTHWRRRGPHH